MTTPDPTRAAMQQALEALETAQSGLQWYRDMHPESVDGSDDEADEVIEYAKARLRASLSSLAAGEEVARTPLVACPVCGGEAVHAQDVLARTIIAPAVVATECPLCLNDASTGQHGIGQCFVTPSAPRGAAGEAKRGAAEEPLPPEVLVDALQDRAHDIGELKPCTRSRGGLPGAAGEGGERGAAQSSLPPLLSPGMQTALFHGLGISGTECAQRYRDMLRAAGLRGDEAQITPQNRHGEAGTDGVEASHTDQGENHGR